MNDIIKSIEEIVTQSERFKSSFFWSPPKNAWARRKYEECNSRKKIEWEEGGNLYTAEFVVECSCKNIYATGCYTKNGKKTTLTAVKNSLNRLNFKFQFGNILTNGAQIRRRLGEAFKFPFGNILTPVRLVRFRRPMSLNSSLVIF